MSENMMAQAHTVAKPNRSETGEALKKALEMHFLRVGDRVEGGIVGTKVHETENVTTYRTSLSSAALNQVRFKPGRNV